MMAIEALQELFLNPTKRYKCILCSCHL